ncbi:hypothetical protein D3C77_400830 [compost metagenome]
MSINYIHDHVNFRRSIKCVFYMNSTILDIGLRITIYEIWIDITVYLDMIGSYCSNCEVIITCSCSRATQYGR